MSRDSIGARDGGKGAEARPEDAVGQQAEVLADFRSRMTPREADKYLGVRANTVRGAIERGEIEYIRIGTRCAVTPAALAEWVERYLVVRPDPLAG